MQVCFITGQANYMLGTAKSSGSLHCYEHFMSVALSSLPIQSWNWLQAAVVNNLYCKSNHSMDTIGSGTGGQGGSSSPPKFKSGGALSCS